MILGIDHHPNSSVALIDADSKAVLSYEKLCQAVYQQAQRLAETSTRTLVFIIANNSVATVIAYLSCLEAKYPVCLIEPGNLVDIERLIQIYQPGIIIANNRDNFEITNYLLQVTTESVNYFIRQLSVSESIHESLALLLTTSGSTGSPKLVRLTQTNLYANADSIRQYLTIISDERAILSLPIYYSYGLSVLNSHLLVGASIVITTESFMQPSFWYNFKQYSCTSFAGVPYMYETLHRLRFEPAHYPSLRTMTQAGGALKKDLIIFFTQKCQLANKQFFVMYGQTEATARIAYVPPQAQPEKAGAIGVAIPNGTLRLEAVEGFDASELIYEGPNVMMGYAEDRHSLAVGDTLRGVLHTGDLAQVDRDGFFWIVGRLKRFAKLFGKRISLDELEREIEETFLQRVALIERENKLIVFIETQQTSASESFMQISQWISKRIAIPPVNILTHLIAAIPLTPSGKKDYKALVL